MCWTCKSNLTRSIGATAVFETAAEIPPAAKSLAKLTGSKPFDVLMFAIFMKGIKWNKNQLIIENKVQKIYMWLNFLWAEKVLVSWNTVHVTTECHFVSFHTLFYILFICFALFHTVISISIYIYIGVHDEYATQRLA